jgi:hypothetical protein
MPTDTILTNLVRHDWLTDSPLESVVTTYIHALRSQRYADRTIRIYLGCLLISGSGSMLKSTSSLTLIRPSSNDCCANTSQRAHVLHPATLVSAVLGRHFGIYSEYCRAHNHCQRWPKPQ